MTNYTDVLAYDIDKIINTLETEIRELQYLLDLCNVKKVNYYELQNLVKITRDDIQINNSILLHTQNNQQKDITSISNRIKGLNIKLAKWQELRVRIYLSEEQEEV